MLRSLLSFSVARGCSVQLSRRAFAAGAQGSALSSKTVGEVLDEQAQRLEHRDALRDVRQDIRWTYLELQDHVNAVSVGLLQNRIISGQMFINALPNDAENIVDFFAAAKGRTVMVPVRPNASLDELREALTATNARGWVLTHKFNGEDRLKHAQELVPELSETLLGDAVRSFEFRNLTQPIQTGTTLNRNGFLMYRDLPVYDPFPSPLPELAKSINTTDPVLASVVDGQVHLHSHSNLVNNSAFLGEKLGFVQGERVYLASEPHTSINHVVVLAAIQGGSFVATQQLPNLKDKNVLEQLRAIERENATALVASAELARAIIAHPHVGSLKYHLNRVAVVTDGNDRNADQLASDLAKAVSASSGHVIVASRKVCGAVALDGKALPHSSIQVCDASGNKAADGSEGVLHVKGHQTHGEGWVDTGVRAKSKGGAVHI